MNKARAEPIDERVVTALNSDNPSTRLKAALAVGTNPDERLVDTLVARCAIEPDFYVRDMLTWALIRLPSEITVPRLLTELHAERTQARSQALHTLSKVKDGSAWPSIPQSLLRDPNDEVAQAAWRAAVVLVPMEQEKALAEELALQLGRGGHEVQRSLSISIVALGGEVVEPILRGAMASDDPRVRSHAYATLRLLSNPDLDSQYAVNQVKRILAPGGST